MERIAEVTRETKETSIFMKLNLDGEGKSCVNTGIGFFDHMLEGFSKHGFFDLEVKITGDLHVDGHHTVEDAGIVLGTAIKNAVGDKKGIKRYGYFILPMDDALALCAVDLCGRPYLQFDCTFPQAMAGSFDIKMLSGENSHHMTEAVFKAFAKALDDAVTIDKRINDVLSTKGSL